MISRTLKSYPYAQYEIASTLACINFQFNLKKDMLENCRSGGSLSYICPCEENAKCGNISLCKTTVLLKNVHGCAARQ